MKVNLGKFFSEERKKNSNRLFNYDVLHPIEGVRKGKRQKRPMSWKDAECTHPTSLLYVRNGQRGREKKGKLTILYTKCSSGGGISDIN